MWYAAEQYGDFILDLADIIEDADFARIHETCEELLDDRATPIIVVMAALDPWTRKAALIREARLFRVSRKDIPASGVGILNPGE